MGDTQYRSVEGLETSFLELSKFQNGSETSCQELKTQWWMFMVSSLHDEKRRVLIGKQYKDNFHLYTWEKHGESEKNRD